MAIPGTTQAPFFGYTTNLANADLDSYVPSDGRTATSTPDYLAKDVIAVYHIAQYTPGGAALPTDGTTSIATTLSTVLAKAIASGGGRIVFPWTALGYNIGSASPGIAVPSNVTLECDAAPLFLNYSGTGIGIDTIGSSYAQLRNIYLVCSNDAASGIRFGGSSGLASRWCRMDNVTAQGSGTLTNTGTAFILDSGPQFCAFLHGRQVYGLGFKYGLNVIGQSVGAHTWTTVTLDMLVLVGRAAGAVAGSRGIRTDVNSNLEASSLPGVIIEGFEQSYEFANAASAIGFTMTGAGIEGNTTNLPMPPASYNGQIEDFHADFQYRQTTNALANRWMQELINQGIWTTESQNSRLHAQYDGSAIALLWGLQRGGSPIAGEYAADKFIVSTGAQGDVGVLRNWQKLLEYKTTFDSAAPTVGSWGKGSRIWNSKPLDSGNSVPVSWDCTASGTLKSSPGNTASTTSGSPTVTVSAISTLERNDYITIAGAFTNPTRIKSISGTTLVMESNASGTVSGVAVVYPTPTFVIPQRYGAMGADRGDANVVLTIDEGRTQRFLTTLTANRTIQLPTPLAPPLCNGDKWKIFRSGLGAFTLTIQNQGAGTIKVLPSATAAWADIECDYTGTYYLTGYGTL